MGITGLIPFLEKASRRANVDEFSGCTVAIDSYCWLHKGAFACADKLVRGEATDIHIKYCLKYVTMLLSKNIKPILVFDGRHLPAKAMTESKRRESRGIAKKRAAELLSLGKIEEARSYMRRSVDITHAMALALIQECRKRNVDCIVAPYEADAQLAYLNIKNIAHLVITEDSDLILFGCTKVLFKMDLEGFGTLVETARLPLVMRCPVEQYSFGKFRRMCIMSGCDYVSSLPGIGLAKARQFVTATQDSNFANALRKLPSFFNKSSLVVTDEYRENFLKAEATFKHQYVYDPLERKMVRLTEPDDEDIEQALCVNAGELLDDKTAFQLALGNLDPFTLKKMDDWHPDTSVPDAHVKTASWKDKGVAPHPSVWRGDFTPHLSEASPWTKKTRTLEAIIAPPRTRPRQKVVDLVAKYVPETQDESLTIESLSNMYCTEPASKKQKMVWDQSEMNSQDTQNPLDIAHIDDEIVKQSPSTQRTKSPILENKKRTFKKTLNSYSVLKRLSKFPRTVLGDNVVESKFFSSTSNSDESTSKDTSRTSIVIEESPEKVSRNPFKVKSPENNKLVLIDTQCSEIPDSQTESVNPIKVKTECNGVLEIDTQCTEIPDSQFNSSQKENSPQNSPMKKQKSPILEFAPRVRNTLKVRMDLVQSVCEKLSEDSVIDNTYPLEELVTPVDSQVSYGESPPKPRMPWSSLSQQSKSGPNSKSSTSGFKKASSKAPLKRTTSLPTNQPTLLSKFGFQKKSVMKR